jgi:outer membrane protein assembly factor BamB
MNIYPIRSRPWRVSSSRLFVMLVVSAVFLIPALNEAWAVDSGPSVDTNAVRIDWPEFRGPWANGHVSDPGDPEPIGLPLQWSETENVRWKTPIPHKGWSTPIVMDGRVWLTTATENGHDFFVLALDAETGQVLINRRVFHSDNPEPLGNNVNCYASPSPVAEPGRVYVHFGTYGTACLDAATGDVLWERRDLPCRHYRGPGSSPILFENLIVLTFDGVDVQYVTALDKASGETVWRTDRSTVWSDLDESGLPKREGDFRKAYSTPIVVETAGRPLLISPGSSAAFAYDARTGQEVWKTQCPGYTAAARPVFGGGHVYITTGRGQAELWAVDVSGQGDVTNRNVSWKVAGKAVPQEASPVLADGLLYLVSNRGVATCLEADTGTQVWSERVGGNFMASPIYANGRLYLSSMQGETTVLRAGRSYEVLATSRLEAGFMASPAVHGRALILRTKTHLYRIESDGS